MTCSASRMSLMESRSIAIAMAGGDVSSMQLVGTIEESITRVSDLVKAVKSYAH